MSAGIAACFSAAGCCLSFFFFFSSRRRHTRSDRDWSSDVCSSDLALALGAMQLFPGITHAQAKRIVFATFTGSWEEAHRDVLVPAYRKAANGAEIVLDPMLSVDQIAKVTAARANPPIDVMLHDPGPALVAVGNDLVEPYPTDKSTYYKDLIAEAQEPTGPAIFFQAVR